MGIYPGSESVRQGSQDDAQQKQQQVQQQKQREATHLACPDGAADDTWAPGSHVNVSPFNFPSFTYPQLQQQWQGLAAGASPMFPHDHLEIRDRALSESYGWGVGGGEGSRGTGLSQAALAMPRSWSGDSGGSGMSDAMMRGRHEASVAALLS